MKKLLTLILLLQLLVACSSVTQLQEPLSLETEFEFPFPLEITAIAISPNGEILAVALGDEVHLLNASSGELIEQREYESIIHSITFASNGSQIMMGGVDPRDEARILLYRWHLENDELSRGFSREFLEIPQVIEFSPDSTFLLVNFEYEPPSIYTAEQINLRHQFIYGEHATWSHSGEALAADSTTGYDNTLRLVDAQTYKVRWDYAYSLAQNLNDMAFSTDDTLLAVSYSGFSFGEDEIQIFNVETGEKIAETYFTAYFPRNEMDNSFMDIEFSPTAEIIAASARLRGVRLFSARTGKPLAEVNTYTPTVIFSPDGQRLYTFHERTVSVWRVNAQAALAN